MGYVVGDTISTYHKVFDTTGAIVSGLAASDFLITFVRNGAAAGEAVTVAEIGATAVYRFSFVAANTGTYSLHVREKATIPNSSEASFDREWTVASVGEDFGASYDYAFCAESDIVGYAGVSFGADTNPSTTQVRGFAESVAARIMAGFPPGILVTPSGMGNPVSTATDEGKNLSNLLRQANAIGAASWAKRSALLGQPPNESPLPDILWGLFLDLAGGYDPVRRQMVEGVIPGMLVEQFPTARDARSFSHVSQGWATSYTPATATESALPFDESTKF